MPKRINRNGPEPLYDQVKEAIAAYIEQERLGPNDLLPSEREFCDRFGVSRLTLRKALERLIQEGLVFRRAGKGTFVSLPKLEQRLLVVTSFTEAIRQEGRTPGTQLLGVEVAEESPRICEHLEIPIGSQVLNVRRLRSVDDQPFSLATSYLPHDLTCNLEAGDLQASSLYALLKDKCHLELARSKVTVEATVADAVEAALLHIKPGGPLFRMTGTLHITTGRVIEYSRVLYRGDSLRFVAESD